MKVEDIQKLNSVTKTALKDVLVMSISDFVRNNHVQQTDDFLNGLAQKLDHELNKF